MPDDSLDTIAPAFVRMAHEIAWATVATVDRRGRPRTRILHPLWDWNGTTLTGVIATGPTPAKVADLRHSPYLSANYWSSNHDTCRADCVATWASDDETCTAVWEAFKAASPPVGYDPAMIPAWEGGPTSPSFAVLRLEPFRLRVFPGAALMGQAEILRWAAPD